VQRRREVFALVLGEFRVGRNRFGGVGVAEGELRHGEHFVVGQVGVVVGSVARFG
jgi:hypothetical protein